MVDPVRDDPRKYILFDLTTGAPIAVGVLRKKNIAEVTARLINNQTLNDARRATRDLIVAILKRFAKGGDAREVAGITRAATPHRAILRELVLEEDQTLNPYRTIVEEALERMPALKRWALNPRRPSLRRELLTRS